ncbi:hypothetical protein PAECIP111894_05970 [Paenibacillus pseudetheri]|uniref:Uncharacterized protein n=1 Tax=Paenibacillus pseudetheri TaxID=2897682 RepID=A0ABM9BKN8_9BACL|nr:hypothetical protein PAECIP111894_05970 [Paenibacillus pseudetheri]
MNKQEEIIFRDVRIKDDLIVEIGTGLIPYGEEKIIDATNRTLIPGFVQTHIHLCQTLLIWRLFTIRTMLFRPLLKVESGHCPVR